MAVTKETLRAAADARKQLRQLTDKQAVALVKAWVDAWDTLSPAFAEALAELVAHGDRVPRTVVARNKKLIAALEQARATLEELIDYADATVTNDVMTAVLDAATSHQAMIGTQLPPDGLGATINVNAPAPGALQAIVTRTTEQIHSATKPLTAWTIQRMKQQLVRGIAVGDNPMKVARNLIKETEGEFNGGLARAMTIARTEMLDAHRRSTLASNLANTDILNGWIWMATLDHKICPSCLAQHGTLHPADEFGPIDHPNGRCAAVPKTVSWRDLGFDIDEPEDDIPDAKAWFDNLEEESQLAIMGPTRLKLLTDGLIDWEDLSTQRTNTGWRDSIGVTNVGVLVKKAAR